MTTPVNPPTQPITGSYSRKQLDMLSASIPTNLPALREKLIGRDQEQQVVQGWLSGDDVRMVTITGFGGAGKTTLSLQIARNLLSYFSGGVFFVDLSALSDPAMILPAVARTLFVQEEPKRSLRESLRDFLANRFVLLVLDNFEQLVDGSPILVELLTDSPHLRLLVTTREPLRLRGEQVLPLRPLDEASAMELFTRRAKAINPDFSLTEDSKAAISAVCSRLGGLPLAIELAAFRSRVFSPVALLARLQSNALATLASGARDLPARQQTLRDTIAWSFNLLDEPEKQVFLSAGMLQSAFCATTLAAIAKIPEADAYQLLSSLVDKNLIQPVVGETPRFVMLDTIREFAREQVQVTGEWTARFRELVLFFSGLARQAAGEIENGDAAKGFASLELEYPSLLEVLESALHAGEIDLLSAGLEILVGLDQYWFQRCYYEEAVKYTSLALGMIENKPAVPVRLAAMAYGMMGSLDWLRYQHESAVAWHRKALEVSEKAGDRSLMSRSMNNLAVNLDELSLYDQADRYFEQGLELARQSGDTWSELRLLCNMGSRYHTLFNEVEKAESAWQAALGLASKAERSFEFLTIQYNICCLKYAQGELQETARVLESLTRQAVNKDYPQLIAYGKGLQAMVALDLQNLPRAAEFLRMACRVSVKISEFNILHELAYPAAGLCALRGNLAGALRLWGIGKAHVLDELIHRTLPYWRGMEPVLSAALAGVDAAAREQAIKAGEMISPDELLRFIEYACALSGEQAPVDDGSPGKFTEREQDTLRYLVQGLTNEEIARELVVVQKTVEKHVASILRKLGVKNRTEAVAWAIQNGLGSADQSQQKNPR